MNAENNQKIYHVINAVQADLAKIGISKAQKNAQQGYMFRGIDDVLNTLGPLLAEHKLLIFPRMLSRHCEQFTNTKGNLTFHVSLDAEYDFTAVEDGSSKTIKVFGEAMDTSDKATNKAMSAAYKYAMIQAFAIPIEGESDADSETHEVAGTKQEAPLPSRPVKVPPRTPQREDSAAELWTGLIDFENSKPYHGITKSGPKTGEPYTLYRITLDDGRTATTFDEEVGMSIKGWDVLHEARVWVAPNKRKEGTWEWLKPVEKVETPKLPEDGQQ